MKRFYTVKATVILCLYLITTTANSQTPTFTTFGACQGVIANFNTNDNGFNSPSVYGSIFDSSLYYHAGRGYWTDYNPPLRVNAPGFPRVLNIISPPYPNPNPTGTFTVGFYYICSNAAIDQFQVRIISVTQTSMGTVTNVEASTGLQRFGDWSIPVAYQEVNPLIGVPDPTPFMAGHQGNVCIRLIDPDIMNGANTTFRVEVSYIINGALFAVFDNLSIGPVNIPLPVNFIGLVANRNSDNSVSLKWDVTEEINVNHYEIERSTNGTSFTTVGSVAAKGKSIYAFGDPYISTSNLFYRVKSVDIDGRTKYSGVVRIKGNASNSYGENMLIFPVPATDQITIEHKRITRDAKIIITSMEGRTVQIVVPSEGSSHTPINISALKSGVYLVRLDDGRGNIQTSKLIKN